jgi:hypothetical protein
VIRELGVMLYLFAVAGNGDSLAVERTSVESGPARSGLPEPVPFDSATTLRYRESAAKLAAAVGTGDPAAFRALHTNAGWAQTDDWWKAMLADHKRSFGRIVRAVGPLRGSIRMGTMGVGLPPNGAAILLRFERGLGASMSFELDEAGKITKSSLWVQRELATANPDGAEVLWEARKKGAKR